MLKPPDKSVWRDIQLLFNYPLFYKRYICRSFHFLFYGRHYLQEIVKLMYLSKVERNPAGDFGTRGKNFVRGFWSTTWNIWFCHFIDPDFIRTLSKQRTSIYPVYDVYQRCILVIENKFMLRRLLCIMGLFLPPNFTLSSLLRFGSDPGSNPEEDK